MSWKRSTIRALRENNTIARNILGFHYGMPIAASAKRFSCFHEIDQIDMGYAVSFLQ